jgi:hypothetical protein
MAATLQFQPPAMYAFPPFLKFFVFLGKSRSFDGPLGHSGVAAGWLFNKVTRN